MHYKAYKTILSPQNGMNLYRGCQHGCIYCDARSACYGMEHDFEDIEVKINADRMLDAELSRKRARCMIATGAMCDPYIPLETELRLTRRCLEIIEQRGFGATVQTKSDRLLRDLDLFSAINANARCVVQMTLTTFDEDLCRVVEPNVCTTRRRFETLCALRDAGIPTVVWFAPLLPFLNDTEENLRGILAYCAEAGVKGVICCGMGLTLREGDREYYYAALDRHFPGLKQRYIERYGGAYILGSERERRLWEVFDAECARAGMMADSRQIFAWLHAFPEREHEQLSLFPG